METQRQFFEQKICELKDSYSTLEQSTELRVFFINLLLILILKIRELEHQLSFANNACENLQKQLETVTTEKLQLGKKAQKSQQIIRKLQADIDEEKQLSKVLLEDKMTLTQKYAELEKQKAEV
jgi:chromosome segregation ATPase